MWLVGGTEAQAYLGTRCVRMRHQGTLVLSEPADGLGDALMKLQAAVAGLARRVRVRVWVSGALARPFILPAISGSPMAEADWLAAAESLSEDATGLPSPSRIWLDGCQSAPRLAVAMNETALASILELRSQRRIAGIAPWWSHVLSSQARGTEGASGLAVRDCDSLTLLLAHGDDYVVALRHAIGPGESADALLARALITQNWLRQDVALFQLPEAADAASGWEGVPA